jgi:hypothetical protein
MDGMMAVGGILNANSILIIAPKNVVIEIALGASQLETWSDGFVRASVQG